MTRTSRAFARTGIPKEHSATPLSQINYHFRQGREHRYAWDADTMGHVLRGIGFTEVRERDFDPELDQEKWREGTLRMEARPERRLGFYGAAGTPRNEAINL